MKLARILFTVQETAKKISEDKITAYAAQTCYYLLLSFMPFIIALINIIHYFPVTSSDLLDLLENIIPQEFHPMLINIFTDIESSSSVALLSLTAIGLLWSAGKGFMTIKRCLNKINNCEYNRSWFIQRIFSSLYTFIINSCQPFNHRFWRTSDCIPSEPSCQSWRKIHSNKCNFFKQAVFSACFADFIFLSYVHIYTK